MNLDSILDRLVGGTAHLTPRHGLQRSIWAAAGAMAIDDDEHIEMLRRINALR